MFMDIWRSVKQNLKKGEKKKVKAKIPEKKKVWENDKDFKLAKSKAYADAWDTYNKLKSAFKFMSWPEARDF